MTSWKTDPVPGCLAHMGARKRLLKAAQRRHGYASMQWIGGILYFSASKQAVPDVREVPKPGKQAIGLQAIAERIPPRQHAEPEHFYTRFQPRREDDDAGYRPLPRRGEGGRFLPRERGL